MFSHSIAIFTFIDFLADEGEYSITAVKSLTLSNDICISTLGNMNQCYHNFPLHMKGKLRAHSFPELTMYTNVDVTI